MAWPLSVFRFSPISSMSTDIPSLSTDVLMDAPV